MASHLPILPPHGPLNMEKLIHLAIPKPKPVREIQKAASATKTTKITKHTTPSTDSDPPRRTSLQRKESRAENAQAALHRHQVHARTKAVKSRRSGKLPAKNPRFLTGRDPIPSEIFKPKDDRTARIASLNSNHIFILAAHRNQQTFDRNAAEKAVAKRNIQMDEHDKSADLLRKQLYSDEEEWGNDVEYCERKGGDFAARLVEMEERLRLMEQEGYFSQAKMQERARPQDPSSCRYPEPITFVSIV